MRHVRRKLGPMTLDIPALFIGVQILAKAWEKMTHFAHHPLIVSLLFLLGGAVVVGSLLTLSLERRLESVHGLFHAAEGVAVTLSAVVLLTDGKLRIPLVLFLAGLAYLASGVFESLPASRRERFAGVMQRSFGAAFLVAGLALAVATALHDRDRWAFGAAGVIASIGVAFLLLPIRFLNHKRRGREPAPVSDPSEPSS